MTELKVQTVFLCALQKEYLQQTSFSLHSWTFGHIFPLSKFLGQNHLYALFLIAGENLEHFKKVRLKKEKQNKLLFVETSALKVDD